MADTFCPPVVGGADPPPGGCLAFRTGRARAFTRVSRGATARMHPEIRSGPGGAGARYAGWRLVAGNDPSHRPGPGRAGFGSVSALGFVPAISVERLFFKTIRYRAIAACFGCNNCRALFSRALPQFVPYVVNARSRLRFDSNLPPSPKPLFPWNGARHDWLLTVHGVSGHCDPPSEHRAGGSITRLSAGGDLVRRHTAHPGFLERLGVSGGEAVDREKAFSLAARVVVNDEVEVDLGQILIAAVASHTSQNRGELRRAVP